MKVKYNTYTIYENAVHAKCLEIQKRLMFQYPHQKCHHLAISFFLRVITRETNCIVVIMGGWIS